MLKLDHICVIAPTLTEGVAHVRTCLDLDVPFGQRHTYMGTHNHLLQLGDSVYLEIVAIDADGEAPPRPRWFGLDDREQIRADWDAGRRLRGWVARTDDIRAATAGRGQIFGDIVALPPEYPAFDFTFLADGSLPLDGAAPSIIDRRGKARSMATISDLGARLLSFTIEHPDPPLVTALYRELSVDRLPEVVQDSSVRYRAGIATPSGVRVLS